MYLLDLNTILGHTSDVLHLMTDKGYDLEEIISSIIDSLQHTGDVPESVNDAYILNGFSDLDLRLVNTAIKYIYKSIYSNLKALNCYDTNGNLTYKYFEIQGNVVVFSATPIENPPR